MIHLKAGCKLIVCRGKQSKYYFPPDIEKRLDKGKFSISFHLPSIRRGGSQGCLRRMQGELVFRSPSKADRLGYA
jgi:hypothetical protein